MQHTQRSHVFSQLRLSIRWRAELCAPHTDIKEHVGVCFPFRLSEITYKLGSYSEALSKAKQRLAKSQKCQGVKQTCNIGLGILKEEYIP